MNDIKEKIQNILQTTPKPVAANKHWLFLHHPIIYNFLKEKYSTFEEDSLSETYYRILNDIDEKPKCVICGKPVHFQKDGVNQYRQFCSKTCLNTKEGLKIKFEKSNKTNLERYGAENPYASPIIKEKLRKTWLERYGAENPYASEEIKNRIKNTLISKYGVDSPQKSEIIKEKTAQTNIKKYGNKMYLQSNEGIKKSKQIIKEKYGDEIYSHTDNYKNRIKEIQEKRHNSLKAHNTYSTSNIEQQFKEYLEQNYPNDFEYQYKSELYPFNCDFYIKSLNLYIEIQGNWTHGFHPFDDNNEDDIKRLNEMKSKNTQYHKNAINTWTIRDVKKRNIAKQNNLNYLEIFSIKLNECIQELNNYIKSLP